MEDFLFTFMEFLLVVFHRQQKMIGKPFRTGAKVNSDEGHPKYGARNIRMIQRMFCRQNVMRNGNRLKTLQVYCKQLSRQTDFLAKELILGQYKGQ